MLISRRSINWRQSSGCAILGLHRKAQLTPKLAPAKNRLKLRSRTLCSKQQESNNLPQKSRDGGTGRRSGLGLPAVWLCDVWDFRRKTPAPVVLLTMSGWGWISLAPGYALHEPSGSAGLLRSAHLDGDYRTARK